LTHDDDDDDDDDDESLYTSVGGDQMHDFTSVFTQVCRAHDAVMSLLPDGLPETSDQFVLDETAVALQRAIVLLHELCLKYAKEDEA
jgi:hypothetical protein